MTQHTPGPWHLCRHLQSIEKDRECPCGYRGGIWGSDEEHIVCEMGSTEIKGEEGLCPPRYPREVELANARLIAAAPDLLAAVTQFLKAHDDEYDGEGMSFEMWEALEKLRAARALAEGAL